MAVAVPVLTTLGGGSAVQGAVLLASATATVAGGVTAANQSRRAGRIAERQSEINAAAEGDAAREREIERKRMLLRAVSSQQARAGAAGVSASEGSPRRIIDLDVAQANRDLVTDRANTGQRTRSLRAQGRAARISGNAQSASTLLDTVSRTATSFLR